MAWAGAPCLLCHQLPLVSKSECFCWDQRQEGNLSLSECHMEHWKTGSNFGFPALKNGWVIAGKVARFCPCNRCFCSPPWKEQQLWSFGFFFWSDYLPCQSPYFTICVQQQLCMLVNPLTCTRMAPPAGFAAWDLSEPALSSVLLARWQVPGCCLPPSHSVYFIIYQFIFIPLKLSYVWDVKIKQLVLSKVSVRLMPASEALKNTPVMQSSLQKRPGIWA